MNFVHRFNRQQVILNKRTIFAVVQVKLSHDIAIRRTHQRGGVFKIFVNKDNTTCVFTQSTDQTFNFLCHLPDFGVVLSHFIYKLLVGRPVIFFIAIESLIESSKHTTVCHNHRCQILCNININTQTTASGQDGRFRLFSAEGSNVGNSILTINFSQVVQNLLTPAALNINVNVKNRHTSRIKETPGKCFCRFPLRVNLSDTQKIQENKTNTGTTATTDKSSRIPTLLNNLL